jgi:hypothetical protein
MNRKSTLAEKVTLEPDLHSATKCGNIILKVHARLSYLYLKKMAYAEVFTRQLRRLTAVNHQTAHFSCVHNEDRKIIYTHKKRAHKNKAFK